MTVATTSILKPRRRKVTQATIARAVGVSIGTVSRVLAADPKLRISEERRRAILDTERRLGGLRRPQKRQLTRIVVAPVNRRFSPREVHEHFPDNPLHRSFIEAMEEADYRLYFSFVAHEKMPGEVRQLVDERQRCDGILILGGICSPEMGRILRDTSFPHISPDPQAERFGINTVHVERAEGWRQAIAQLKSLGHRRIGFLGARTSPTYAEYGSAMLSEGMTIDESLQVWFDHAVSLDQPRDSDLNRAREAVRRRLEKGMGATALICQNDEIALGAVEAMREKGLVPGQAISLVGFGNIEQRRGIGEPILATLENPLERHGRRMAELLLNQILYGQRQIVHERLPGPLIVRSSMGTCLPSSSSQEVL